MIKQLVAYAGLAAIAGLGVGCAEDELPCTETSITMCGNQPVHVFTCVQPGTEDPIFGGGIPAKTIRPPAYLDVAPVDSAALNVFPESIPLDDSVNVGPFPLSAPVSSASGTVTPQVFGSLASNNLEDQAVGRITWGGAGDTPNGTGVLIHPRVVLTAAHVLLAPDEDAAASLSTRVFTFTAGNGGNSKAIGWGFVHPLFDARTRAHDVGMIVLQDGSAFAQTKVASLAQFNPKSSNCACPLRPDFVQVVGLGRGGEVPLEGLPTPIDGPYVFTDQESQRRTIFAQVLRRDALPAKDTTPSIELLSTALFQGDAGAPFFYNVQGKRYLVGLYSGPDSVNSRWGARITPGIVDWVVTSLSEAGPFGAGSVAVAAIPPQGWNGLTIDPRDGSAQGYAIAPPAWAPANPGAGSAGGGDQWGGLLPSSPLDSTSFQSCSANTTEITATQNISAFDNVVVISDSLSDQNNQWANPISGFTPGPTLGYWKGRFTNGFNWVDYLGNDASLKDVNRNFQNQGPEIINLSVGGAFAAKSGIARPSIMEEATTKSWTGQSLPDNLANSLVFIWAGANDINEASKPGADRSNPSGLANKIAEAQRELIKYIKDRGAQRIVIMAIPPLQLVPIAHTKGASDGEYDLSGLVFAAVAVNGTNDRLRALATETPGALFVDDNLFIKELIDAEDDAHRSINMYQLKYACINQSAQSLGGGNGYTDARCQGYMFFDNLHPTTIAHCGLSRFFEAEMIRAGYQFPAGVPQPLEQCAQVSQNEDWRGRFSTSPARTRYFYVQQANPIVGEADAKRVCTNACPAGYLWAPPAASSAELPNWFDIKGPPVDGEQGFPPTKTPPGLILANGWEQPTANPGAGSKGACGCVVNHFE